jgi:hypothetical protein
VNAGQTATFTAAATGEPTPTVRWQIAGVGGAFADIAGATSTTLSFTAAAGHNANQYRAVFTNSVGTSTSNAATLTVPLLATSTALTSSANPSLLNQPVELAATVSPVPPGTGMPTGTVTFTIDGSVQPPVVLTSGVARITRSNLGPGSHTISAQYGGGDGFAGSASAPLVQQVRYRFDGFSGKVKGAPQVNDIRAGRPVALRWQITDAFGVGVTDPASFVSLTVAPASCSTWAPTGPPCRPSPSLTPEPRSLVLHPERAGARDRLPAAGQRQPGRRDISPDPVPDPVAVVGRARSEGSPTQSLLGFRP